MNKKVYKLLNEGDILLSLVELFEVRKVLWKYSRIKALSKFIFSFVVRVNQVPDELSNLNL